MQILAKMWLLADKTVCVARPMYEFGVGNILQQLKAGELQGFYSVRPGRTRSLRLIQEIYWSMATVGFTLRTEPLAW